MPMRVEIRFSTNVEYEAVLEVPFDADEIAGEYEGDVDDYVRDWIADEIDTDNLALKGDEQYHPNIIAFRAVSADYTDIDDVEFRLSQHEEEELGRAELRIKAESGLYDDLRIIDKYDAEG